MELRGIETFLRRKNHSRCVWFLRKMAWMPF